MDDWGARYQPWYTTDHLLPTVPCCQLDLTYTENTTNLCVIHHTSGRLAPSSEVAH